MEANPPHDYRPRFPAFRQSNDLGQWCHRCRRWIGPGELDTPCPGVHAGPPPEAEERHDWYDAG